MALGGLGGEHQLDFDAFRRSFNESNALAKKEQEFNFVRNLQGANAFAQSGDYEGTIALLAQQNHPIAQRLVGLFQQNPVMAASALDQFVRGGKEDWRDTVQSKFITDQGTVGVLYRSGRTEDTGVPVQAGYQFTDEGVFDPSSGRMAAPAGAGDPNLQAWLKQREDRRIGEESRKARGVAIAQADVQQTKEIVSDTRSILPKIDVAISNLEDAMSALAEDEDGSAAVGVLASFLPTWRDDSIALENAMYRMGIDVINSVTFGALSEKELELAIDTGTPKKMSKPALQKWFRERYEARKKLRQELLATTSALMSGRMTLKDYWDMKAKEAGAYYDPETRTITFRNIDATKGSSGSALQSDLDAIEKAIGGGK